MLESSRLLTFLVLFIIGMLLAVGYCRWVVMCERRNRHLLQPQAVNSCAAPTGAGKLSRHVIGNRFR